MPIVRHVKYARKQDHNIYIGRKIEDYTGMKIRDASILNNPFPISNYNDQKEREESIKQYRVWLYQHLRDTNTYRSAPYWNALRKIQESSVLLCHCYPKHCHGNIIIKAWQWAKEHGLIEPVHTNHTDKSTLENVARANAKDIAPAHTALGPLPMDQITKAIADARLDEQILESHAVSCDDCPAPVNALQRSLPPKKKQGIGAPTKPRDLTDPRGGKRAPRITYTDPRGIQWNRIDDMVLDLAEIPMVAA